MEDESSVAEGLKMVLNEEGYDVDLATTGQGALDSFGEKGCDLLVADLRLPDMDGMEVIKRVKGERPETPVIVITGYASVLSAVEAMKTGVVDYLPKPFTDEEFMARVDKALKERREALSEEVSESVGPVEEGMETPTDELAGQPQVLLMEDEPSVAEGLKMILAEEGYGVDLATTGQSALDTLRQKDFDLLVADLRLPDMDGMEVIKRVKEKRPETEVIVITGYATIPSAAEAMRTGVVDYLPKPFTEEQFMATVQIAMKERQEALSKEIREHVEPDIEKPIKVGFYVCHCGEDIPKKVSVEEVVDFARKQPHVAVARTNKYLCQDQGLEMIENDIRQLDLTRVVVAACSPRPYEKIFQDVCHRAGLKPHHLQMASLREQVAWITEDPVEATMKAKTLSAAAIHRVKFQRTLTPREVGGIAGMQAALDIAEAGHKAYLAERQPTIGGHMLQFDKTFPTLDCAACIGTPKMVSVGQSPNIELLTCSEVAEVSGFVGNYKVKIQKKPRYIDLNKCTGCGDCARACVVGNVIQIPEMPPLPVMEPEEESALEATLSAHENQRRDLIAILIEISDKLGYLPRPVLTNLAYRLDIPLSEAFRVATFYAQFRFEPLGKYQVMVCQGTACHVQGSRLILEAVTKKLGIEPGETTPDLMFSSDRVACFGACALAPVVVINDKVFAGMSPMRMEQMIDELATGRALQELTMEEQVREPKMESYIEGV
jgi:DNA-binding response OmpR family regulator/NADH:ubiquinone oxidoreductase subunit E